MNPSIVRWLGAGAIAALAVYAAFAVPQNKPPEAAGQASHATPAPDAEQAHETDAASQPMKAAAETAGLPEEIDAKLGAFFAAMKEARIEAAYEKLLEESKILSRPGDVEMLLEHGRKAIAEYGAIQRFDIIDRRMAGESLLRVTAISVGGDYPLRWRFYFYRATDKWRLLDLRADDGLASMFDPDAADLREPPPSPAPESEP